MRIIQPTQIGERKRSTGTRQQRRFAFRAQHSFEDGYGAIELLERRARVAPGQSRQRMGGEGARKGHRLGFYLRADDPERLRCVAVRERELSEVDAIRHEILQEDAGLESIRARQGAQVDDGRVDHRNARGELAGVRQCTAVGCFRFDDARVRGVAPKRATAA